MHTKGTCVWRDIHTEGDMHGVIHAEKHTHEVTYRRREIHTEGPTQG